MYRYIFICLILFYSLCTYSQEKPTQTNEEIIENYIEEISANTDKEVDLTTLYEDLTYYLNEPLNLNVATKEDLEKLQLLSEFQIENFLNYRKNFGQLLSIYELLNINGFNEEYVRLILPFVTIEKVDPVLSFDPKKAVKYGRHRLFLRTRNVLQTQQGYTPISDSALAASPNSRYLGSPWHLYTRYQYTYKNKVAWGFTAEKDPGEEFFKGTQKRGFDYYSAHLMVKGIGPIKTIVLGDYIAQFGQGLVVWSGYTFGKSSMVTSIRKRAQGLKKYSSADENLFMRGGGVTLSYKNFDISAFVSKKRIDANITVVDSLTGEAEEVSSLQTSGLHTTPAEMSDRKALGETIMGGNISFNYETFRLGLTGITYEFSSPLIKTPKPYNQYEFSGRQNSNIGFDYQFVLKNTITFFGEAAMSQNGAKAFLNSMLFSLSPQTSMALLHRHYERNYQALYAQSFGENTNIINESGIYVGAIILPYAKWRISAYYDIFSFPWLKYETYAPTKGHDYLAEVSYTPYRRVSMYIRYRHKNKPTNIPSSVPQIISGIQDATSQRIRYHIAYRLNRYLEFRNRIEWVEYATEQKRDRGLYFYQDVIYKHQRIPLNIAFRFGIFDTDSYDSRIYAYENDILYAFSVPAVYYKGSRAYITLKYSPKKNIDIWLKFGETYFSNKDVISSGLTEIKGNTKSEIKAQVRFSF
ncbi:MAG: helix-hairpin-helix domain-containing protein [Bacteroidales bacterium]|nr:helix-hairpin-helix domain-containing protein [Bacteroidales bacterium]